MQHKVLEIRNKDGLRARPASMFVQAASKFNSQILIERGNKKINAKSIMGVLSLGVQCGDAIHLIANGEDERAAIEAMAALVEGDFGGEQDHSFGH